MWKKVLTALGFIGILIAASVGGQIGKEVGKAAMKPSQQEVEAKLVEGFTNRPLKKSMRVQKMVISGVPHPLPTLEKSLVGRSERSAFGSASFLGTFSTAC